MAKSLRNKAKTAARARKREEGTYEVHHAARLARLSERLLKNNPNKEKIENGETAEATKEDGDDDEKMEGAQEGEDGDAPEKKISTSGPRNSRRESWREAKGMKPRATSHGMTGKGKLRGARKAGRPARRR